MLIGVIVVLYLAKEVLIPLALAVLFSFLLGPPVRRLERWHLWRVPAVLLVTAAFFGLFGGLGYITVHQVNDLAGKLPSYQVNIQQKLKSLQGHGTSLKNAEKVLSNIQSKDAEPPADGKGTDLGKGVLSGHDETERDSEKPPLAVRIVEPPASAPTFLRNLFGPLLGPLGTAFIVVIFTVFILIQREDLRDRLLHLVGPERLPITTQAVDEAGQRVSRYLLMQVTVNVCFGAAVGTGLFFIGVPAAALWGLLAAAFRFVPYVGAWIGAAGPLALSIGAFESTRPVFLTLGLFAGLELVTGNAVEPWLYGTSTGMSPVAVLVAATFWTWLWGGVGLLLSTPLTVCIVVLGRYVPQLAFVHTLLGDEPVLPQDARLYQRLLSADQEQVSQVVDEYLTEHPVAEFYDTVLLPALNQAQTDAHQGSLAEDRQDFILQTVRTLVDDLHDRPPESLAPVAATEAAEAAEAAEATEAATSPPVVKPSHPAPSEPLPVQVLIVPVKTDLDEVAGRVLAHLFALGKVGSEVLSHKSLVNEALAAVEKLGVEAVCISALRPFPVMQARHLAKRLRLRYPELKILIGLWDSKRPAVGARRNLETVHADWVVDTMAEGLAQVCPVVHCHESPALEPTAAAAVETAKETPPVVAAKS